MEEKIETAQEDFDCLTFLVIFFTGNECWWVVFGG